MDDSTKLDASSYRFIGKPIPRKEDARLLTGKGRFTDDFSARRPDLCRDGALAASACAHRRDRHRARAQAMPGVLGVFTGADCLADELKPIPHDPVPHDQIRHEAAPRAGGKPVFIGPHMLLPADKARHVGEAVAMVVARDAARRRWTPPRRSRSTTRSCRSSSHSEDALKPGAPRGVGRGAGQHAGRHLVRRHARRPTAAFAAADHVVKTDFHIGRVTGVPMEPRAALARLRRGDRPLHALCRQRRRGAPEARAGQRARHRARRAARAVLRRRRQFRHPQPRLRRVRPGAVGGAASSAAR